MPRHIARVVDHGVPIASRKAAELAVAVALDAFDLREAVGVGAAAVEERQPMSAVERVLRHVQSEEARAAEDEDAQRPTRGLHRPGGVAGREAGERDRARGLQETAPPHGQRPPGGAYCSTHSRTVLYQNSEFCGLRIQWFSSG